MTARSVEGYISRHTDMTHTSLRIYFLGVTASTVSVGQLVSTVEAVPLIFKFIYQFFTFFAASSASPRGGAGGGVLYAPTRSQPRIY